MQVDVLPGSEDALAHVVDSVKGQAAWKSHVLGWRWYISHVWLRYLHSIILS